MSLMAPYDIFIPKHHLMFHLVLRSGEMGNPWFYHTFLDEAMNKTLKAVSRNCHQLTFESSAIIKFMRYSEQHGMKRKSF